ncbi:type VI secretion system-associated protein TagF [Pseudomonas sp. X10]
MEQMHSRTGFYGKLASHGDFLSRRLSPAFVRCWDEWLQAGLRYSRERLGVGWQEIYRCSPLWHFALAGGVCGEPAWAGVLMPSVDRVGRYFPLTLAYGGPQVSVMERLRRDGEWYAELERLALSSLEGGFSLERFDSALSRVPKPLQPEAWARPTLGSSAAGMLWLERPEEEGMAQAIEQWSVHLAGIERERSQAGHALFWTEGSPLLPPTLVMSQGLPSLKVFLAMLAGRGEYPE